MVQHWRLHKTKNYFEQLISSSKSHHAIYDGGRGLVHYLLERNADEGTTNHQYILLLQQACCVCDNCTRNSRLKNISRIFLVKESFASKEVQVLLLQLLKTLARKFLKEIYRWVSMSRNSILTHSYFTSDQEMYSEQIPKMD